MTTQVVVSRIQNRRGTQATFNSLYVPGAPDEQKLQVGELGLCTDTSRVFIGSEDIDTPIELGAINSSTGLTFSPLIVDLAPAATWTSISEYSYDVPDSSPNTVGLLDIFYSLELLDSPDYVKNGTLSVTSLLSTTNLTDTGTEINTTIGDISFRAIAVGGTVQIQYMHDLPGTVRMGTASINWLPF